MQLHDHHGESPENMAQLGGALRSMRQSQIDLLVADLPAALFAAKRAALVRVMTGKHDGLEWAL